MNQIGATGPQLRREAMSALRRGELRRARALLERALVCEPDHIGALTNQGAVRRALGDLTGAIASYRQALSLSPDNVATGFNLANALKEAGRFDEAIAAYGQVLAIDPCHLRALNNIGIAYKQVGQSAAAEASFRRALDVSPGYGAGLRNLAAVHEDRGDFVAAHQCFLEALANDPADAKALAKIIASRIDDAGQQHFSAADQLLQGDNIGAEERAQLHYGLGKYYDRVGIAGQALIHFRNANSIKASRRKFAGEVFSGRVDKLCNYFSPELFVRMKDMHNASTRPVFIVGMPRTGTTLTEQILSSHPDIAGGGELPYFGSVALEFSERTGIPEPFPDGVALLQSFTIDNIANQYLAELDGICANADRVTDKMPQNFLYLGLIALLFSNARIIHCWRDPRDVCLSCFVEDFNTAHSFASDPIHFASYYRDYCRLMAHWRQVLPIPIFDLRYEDLVGDFEPTARQLLDFVDCEWDAACLSYYKHDRAVTTPSRWQVRQPIYTSSIGRWRQYSEYLTPVLQELTELAEAGSPGSFRVR